MEFMIAWFWYSQRTESTRAAYLYELAEQFRASELSKWIDNNFAKLMNNYAHSII